MTEITKEAQEQIFLNLAKSLEEKQEEVNTLRDALTKSMDALGLGTYVQDQVTKTVYKVVKPKGRYVYFADVDYVRTAQGDERAGSLSKKEAEEAGFALLKKA